MRIKHIFNKYDDLVSNLSEIVKIIVLKFLLFEKNCGNNLALIEICDKIMCLIINYWKHLQTQILKNAVQILT